MADIIARAEDCIRYGLINEHLVRDLVYELENAHADAMKLVQEKQELRDKLAVERADAEMWRAAQAMQRRVGW